jgi:hypothetical protein
MSSNRKMGDMFTFVPGHDNYLTLQGTCQTPPMNISADALNTFFYSKYRIKQ